MEMTAKSLSPFGLWRMRLTDIFTSSRQQELERELAETRTRLELQKKHTERFRQRYDALDRRCAALDNEIDGLRSRLYVEAQRANAFKEAAQAIFASAAVEPKQIYEVLSTFLDSNGFHLFHAAQELTGFRLSEQFPYEDSRGWFELADNLTQMRYLEAFLFKTAEWEAIPGTACKKANLREVDKSTPAYREFERQLYPKVLERLGLQVCLPVNRQS